MYCFSDGYDPRGRSNYNVKVAILDLAGQLFDPFEGVPSATCLLTWRELPRADWASWAVNGRVQQIKKLQATTFRSPAVVAGRRHVVQPRLQLRFLMADHHQMWCELQNGQGCCSCQWDRKNHLANLFTTAPLHLDSYSVRLAGLSNLAQVQAVHPVLHTIKGFGSRTVGVVGRTLPTIEWCTFLVLVVAVARRYELKMDPHTKQCQSKTRSRFRSGLSLTGREVRTLFPIVVQTGKLPSPHHQLFLSFCHIVSLLYGTRHIPPCVWSTGGKVHVYLTLLITEMCEGGSTCTLYAHGMTHFFDYPRLPVHVQDEGGEAWLAVAKRFAGVTSTENSESIRETLQHEHYVQFLKRVNKRNRVEHWHPDVRAILLQPYTVVATECWRFMLCALSNVVLQMVVVSAQWTWPQNLSN